MKRTIKNILDRGRGKLFVVVGGVALSMGLAVFLFGIGEGLKSSLRENFLLSERSKQASFSDYEQGVPWEDVEALPSHYPGVRNVTAGELIRAEARVKDGEEYEPFYIFAYYASETRFRDDFPYKMKSGRFFTNQEMAAGANKCIVSEDFIKKFADSATTMRLDVRIPQQGESFNLALERKGKIDSDLRVLILPYKYYMENLLKKSFVTEIEVYFGNSENAEELFDELSGDYFRRRGRIDENAPSVSGSESFTNIKEDMKMINRTYILVSVFWIALLVMGIVSINAYMNMNLLEREEETAVRKAFGATSWEIFKKLFLEIFLLSSAGCLLGGAAAAVALGVLPWSVFPGVEKVFPTVPFILAAVGALAVLSIVGAITAVRKTAYLLPAEVLRKQG